MAGAAGAARAAGAGAPLPPVGAGFVSGAAVARPSGEDAGVLGAASVVGSGL